MRIAASPGHVDDPPNDPRLAKLRGRLLARIGRRYATTTQTLEVGPLRLPFTRIADPDRVLDEVAEEADRRERLTGQREADPLHLPYWAELWDSAMGVGQWLVKGWSDGVVEWLGERNPAPSSPPPLHHSTAPRLPPPVLDLGCGMGLSGTVAAALGAKVLFADLEPPALLFARLNSLPFDVRGRRVRTRQLNWQTDRLGETFGLIVGTDILYERKQWEFLEPFWRAHLSRGGSVLLGEPGRPTGDAFGEWIGGRGWILEQFEQPVTTRPRPIRIFRITPR